MSFCCRRATKTTGGEKAAYLAGCGFAGREAKVISLQQVDVVAHLCEKVLDFSMFLHEREKQTEGEGHSSVFITNTQTQDNVL